MSWLEVEAGKAGVREEPDRVARDLGLRIEGAEWLDTDFFNRTVPLEVWANGHRRVVPFGFDTLADAPATSEIRHAVSRRIRTVVADLAGPPPQLGGAAPH